VIAVLVVDDEPGVRGLLADVLEELGYEALLAANGAEALARLANRPDARLAIVDLTLPDVDGLEVIRRMRERTPGMPAILSSGHDVSGAGPWAERLAKAREGGAVAVLMKPFRIDALEAALVRLSM
jgi:CheY-like chemotaxis protein